MPEAESPGALRPEGMGSAGEYSPRSHGEHGAKNIKDKLSSDLLESFWFFFFSVPSVPPWW